MASAVNAKRYSIGVDYGTESGRVLLLDLDTGLEAAVRVVPYASGVIDRVLPSTKEPLPPDTALQDPDDYVSVLTQGIPALLRESKVDPASIIGIGIDFTSCTVLPVAGDGTPLCKLPQWREHRHAWPKLWKHHAAQPQADRINEAAAARGEEFLSRYGGRISSEWYFPKLLEIFEADKPVYDACEAFVEAADWIVWQLTGNLRRNSCTAGYKAMWAPEQGLPDEAFFKAVNPAFTRPGEKLGDTFYPLGSCAGTLSVSMAAQLGLSTDVSVAVGNVDAMVSVPGVGVSGPGALVMVMGTSICHLAVTEEEVRLPGITGVVQDGVLPGYYGYEAGQAAVGDMFAWFVRHTVSESMQRQAREAGEDIYTWLERAAQKLQPGETGIVALDWWNGNRSILGDADLSGLLMGLSLSSTPDHIYRALLEATAFGTRRIVDNFREHGVELRELAACGGIAQKSPLLMQIYADICQMPVTVRTSTEVPARGAALFGAVAAGSARGGFDRIEEASQALAPDILHVYQPVPEASKVYDEIYRIYCGLYAHFGRQQVNLMHRLKRIRVEAFDRAHGSHA